MIRQLLRKGRWSQLSPNEPLTLLKESSLKGNLLSRIFMPDGYPDTVHRNYLPFTGWNFLQSATGSIVSVLSTQCLLFGLGLNQGSTATMAAGLNWILKDGLGQLGGIAVVTAVGRRFDWHPKGFRFMAACVLKVAVLLEMLVPLMPGHFVLLGGLANMAKNVCWMATSATRAQIHRHLSGGDNLGDLAAKAASQSTTASLLGTGLGAGLSHLLFSANVASSPTAVVAQCLLIYAPLTALSLFASYQSCTYAISPRITRHRLEMLLDNPHLTPEQVAKRESWLWISRRGIQIEPKLMEYPADLRPFGREAYRTPDALFFTPQATPEDQLRAMLAVHLNDPEEAEKQFPLFRQHLLEAGWSLDEIHLVDRRRPIVIDTSP